MKQQKSKWRKAAGDLVIYSLVFGVLYYFIDYRDYAGLFRERLSLSLTRGIAVAAVIVIFSALARGVIKWKIAMALKRITPEEMETCKRILTGRRWTELDREQKRTVGAIIDKTAFRYSV